MIDFEAQATAAVVNLRYPTGAPTPLFDGLASLLYVDRRGAPENRQLGFDTADKVRLLAAIAGTARALGSARQWISEVNWPLREGPHSPAGRSVAVDEETQADYLVRYFLLAAGGGRVERIDWWQLVAKGYGLCDPQADGSLRERPAFTALASLIRQLSGTTCHGPQAAPDRARALRFTRAREEIVVGWSTGGMGGMGGVGGAGGISWAVEGSPQGEPYRIVDRDGRELPLTAESRRVFSSPRYFYSGVRGAT